MLENRNSIMKMDVEPVAQGVVRVILEGRLDITGAGVIDLQFNAIAGSHRGVVVDLTNVSFLASIGIRTLLLGAKAMQRRGGTLVLLNPVEEVAKVLEVTGVTDLMPIFHDNNAALAAVVA
jgi:anti-sigma B factor antagonist